MRVTPESIMKFMDRYLPYIALATVAFLVGLAVSPAHAQDKVREKLKSKENRTFCSDNWSGDSDHVSFRELRESTASAGGTITVDGRQNGGISVKGTNTANEVVIRACIQAWGKSEDAAKASASSIRIVTTGTIHAEGSDTDKNWSVSYEILVPRNSNLNLTAHNGGISIRGIDGNAEFETMNGGVFLSDVAGSFKGRTTNGGVFVKLSGDSWKGSGLDVTTTNGGVNILMPETYAAHVETGTVNGGFQSDIPALNVTTENIKGDDWGRQRTKRIATNFNGGGAPIRIITTNGGVRISSDTKD